YFLRQCSIIKTVVQQLKSICQIEHTRHQRSDNLLIKPLANLPA
ncbi:TPA: IS982 family transposase, partial [Legionella pneumophila]|nr:IS982 family transposase [Legionella pneumophila]